jgi:hypothetical protein
MKHLSIPMPVNGDSLAILRERIEWRFDELEDKKLKMKT